MSYVCVDSETCGLFGPIVLLQWGEGDDGPIHLHSPMRSPIKDTLEIFRFLSEKKILGFNLAFDIFKIQQQMTTLMLLGKRVGLSEKPIDHIDAYALCEPEARDGPCFKPAGALDLMLHARKGPWQNLMARDPIVIRRVPVQLANPLVQELERRLKIPDIFFAKKRPGEPKWKIKEIKNADGINPDFVNLELGFYPNSGLKALATQELGLDPLKTLVFSMVDVHERFLPVENGFAPFALSVGRPGRWNRAWPDVINVHDSHWAYNDLAREYATKDIVYPRALYGKWGRPSFDDDDSMLACLAGAARWKGYAVDVDGLQSIKEQALQKMKLAPRAPAQVMEWIKEFLQPEEQLALIDPKSGGWTTKKVVLEEIQKTFKECQLCIDRVDHAECKLQPHRAAVRASLVLDSRKAKKQTEVCDKLILAQRFHVSVNVIGTKSTRQSGGQVTENKKRKKSPGLNPQGINKEKTFREKFPLAFDADSLKRAVVSARASIDAYLAKAFKELPPLPTQEWAELGYPILEEKLVGGDFDAFEVNIADAYYQDPQLHADLTTLEPPCDHGECKWANYIKETKSFEPCCSRCTGEPPKTQKIHALVGTLVYPPRTYWEIRATDGKDKDGDPRKKIPGLREIFPDWPIEHWANLYTRAKSALFALIYFGDENTLADRLNIPKEDGRRAMQAIMSRWTVMASKREDFDDRFCPIRQPDGGRVFWNEPDDYVESMLGFKRFFTLENQTEKAIYELAESVPDEWKKFKVKVVRRDKTQTVWGATRSALYGAGFGLQGANKRAAGNHVIQSTGAQLTKRFQRRIWDLQPSGINCWVVRPMNVHDELPTALVPSLEEKVAQIQKSFIEEHRAVVPLLGMKWKAMGTWGGK